MKLPKATWRRLERIEAQAQWRTFLAEEPTELTPEEEEAWERDFCLAILEVYGSVTEARAWFHPDNADVLDLVEERLRAGV